MREPVDMEIHEAQKTALQSAAVPAMGERPWPVPGAPRRDACRNGIGHSIAHGSASCSRTEQTWPDGSPDHSPARFSAGRECPLCGRHEEKAHEKSWIGQDGIRLRQCCGTLLAWAWPSVAAYENHYQTDIYHRDACLAMGLPTQYDRFEEHRQADRCRIAYLSGHFDWPRLTVLDVGASNGAFVYAASHDLPCALAAGLEPNPAIARWARDSHGVTMEVGDWSQMQGQWDLVIATDIIEHLTDPVGFLCRARAHAPFLYLETPDWTPQRPHDWKHIKPYEHICLYSEPPLLELALRCGWIVRDVDRPIEGKLAVLLETCRK